LSAAVATGLVKHLAARGADVRADPHVRGEGEGAVGPLGPGIITPALCDALPLLSSDGWPEILRTSAGLEPATAAMVAAAAAVRPHPRQLPWWFCCCGCSAVMPS
jgi:hypothetical protein